jgi:dTMP kinase
LQLALLDPERYFVVNGNQTIEKTHSAIIARVSEIAALKRNAREDKGNLLLRPIRAASKVVRTTAKRTSASATKAVKRATPKKKTSTAGKRNRKPAKK